MLIADARVHRGNALAEGHRPGGDDGPRCLRATRMESL